MEFEIRNLYTLRLVGQTMMVFLLLGIPWRSRLNSLTRIYHEFGYLYIILQFIISIKCNSLNKRERWIAGTIMREISTNDITAIGKYLPTVKDRSSEDVGCSSPSPPLKHSSLESLAYERMIVNNDSPSKLTNLEPQISPDLPG